MRRTEDSSTSPAHNPARPYRAGVDIGGTFTDFVLVDDRNGELRLEKVLTTPEDPSRAVRVGLERLLSGDARPEQVDVLIHGTTLVINALIERKGSRTALVTTRGFRDVLQLAREYRYDIYDLNIVLPEPLVPRKWRHEVAERVLASGEVRSPLDEGELVAVARQIREQGAESIAVCFLHSYRNPSHELAAREILARVLPGVPITLSHELLGQVREYERTVLTVMNAYVRPVVGRYLERVQGVLDGLGFAGNWYVMASNGGVLAPGTAAEFPVRILESGPVGGALAATHHGKEVGRTELVAFDMGGTTAKSCIIEGGAPAVTTDYEVARVSRFMKSSGLPVRLPVVNMIEIGAGGGSIARLDALGLIAVGPESAGAVPGPACYGRGGTEATVTDANLVLGYLDAGYFLGGEMKLDTAAAERALAELGRPLGLDAAQAAWGVHEIVTNNMAEALRTHAAERGVDTRKLTMVAFGGAGPMHAYGIARALKIPAVLFPRAAGVFSALGFLTAPLSFDLARSAVTRVSDLKVEEMRALYEDMEGRSAALFASIGVPRSGVRFERSVDMRYAGQGFEITVPLPEAALAQGDLTALQQAFDDAYQAQYGRLVEGASAQVVTWRSLALGPQPELRLTASSHGSGEAVPRGWRRAFLPAERRYIEYPIFDRYAVGPGAEIHSRSEAAMRAAIREVPEETYRGSASGDALGRSFHFSLAVHVKDGEVWVEVEDATPQLMDCSFNAPLVYTYAFTVYPLKCLLHPRLPNNEGCFKPFKVTAPPGTILSALPPAPVEKRNRVGHFIHAALFEALAPVMPDRVMAPSGSAPTTLENFSWLDEKGKVSAIIVSLCGGTGACPTRDGEVAMYPSNISNTPVELMESLAPILVETKELISDSGGPGKHRGGLGQRFTVRNISGRPVTHSFAINRLNHPAQGLLGGGAGTPNRVLLNGAPHPQPYGRWILEPGDVVTMDYPGGGGLFPPTERDRAKVREDLENGLISEESARRDYGLE